MTHELNKKMKIHQKEYEAYSNKNNEKRYKYVFEAHKKQLNEIISDKNIGNVFFYVSDNPETL